MTLKSIYKNHILITILFFTGKKIYHITGKKLFEVKHYPDDPTMKRVLQILSYFLAAKQLFTLIWVGKKKKKRNKKDYSV